MKRRHSFWESLPGLRRMVRHFWPYIRTQRFAIAVSLLALFAEVILRILEPWPLKFIFDSLLGSKRSRHLPLTALVQGINPTTLILLAVVALVVFTGLRALAEYGNTIGF